MSQTALTAYADLAQKLTDILDQHQPAKGNQTLLSLADLTQQLETDNPLRQSIEQQMAKIASTTFPLDNQSLNKTLITLGTLKGRLSEGDMAQDKIDQLMATVLSAKFDLVSGQSGSSSSSSSSEPASTATSSTQPATVFSKTETTAKAEPDLPSSKPAPSEQLESSQPSEISQPSSTTSQSPALPESESESESESQSDSQADTLPQTQPEPETKTEPESTSTVESESATTDSAADNSTENENKHPISIPSTASPADDQPQVAPLPQSLANNDATDTSDQAAAPAPIDQFADQIHALQISLDQLPASTRQAFAQLKPVEEAGTVQAYIQSIIDQSADAANNTDAAKAELEKLSSLMASIEDAPAEADQFQVLYDQVDPKYKDPKSGVFSIFQREYGGNARRFVVERTAQYAKYVPAEESKQRMIEDLHKLTEQAQKSLSAAGTGKSVKADKPSRAFFHG